MSEKPLISFVIPTYQRIAWLPEALQGLLGQSMKEVEVVVVDDGSTDGTREFLDDWGSHFPNLKVIKNENNLGAGPSRNIGAEAASADIIGICDSDDVYAAEHAELIVNHFKKNPESELVNFGYVSVGYYNEILEEFAGEPFDYERFKRAEGVNWFANPTVGIKKSSLLEVGGYEKEEFNGDKVETDDFKFVRKWVKAGKKIDYVPGFLSTFHRILPDSMMSKVRGWSADWLKKA